MYPLYFSAVLKSATGKLLEYGEACLSQADNSIDFNGEFVPLMNFRENAEIVRILGEKELEHFPGYVYRCTKKSLRLTDIPSEQIERAKLLFDVNAHIPISLALSPNGTSDFADAKASHIGANIRYISPNILKITALEFVPEGQIFLCNTDTKEINLNKLCARVTQRIQLKHSATVLLCEIINPSNENKYSLTNFFSAQNPQIRLL